MATVDMGAIQGISGKRSFLKRVLKGVGICQICFPEKKLHVFGT